MIRAIQLIDSLNAGGAERLSVSLANTLVNEIDKSFLCATRTEGILKSSIQSSVSYLFLEKKYRLDLKAVFKLRKFIIANKINVIHAHSTSFFLATLVKLLCSNLKIIWHDHYGQSEHLDSRPKTVLKLYSYFFSHIFCVNQHLLQWSKNNLYCKSVSYLRNFVMLENSELKTQLKGKDNKRILCLANLRDQKDHITLFKAFKSVIKIHPEWTLHCVGKDFNDNYSAKIKNFVSKNNLEEHIYFYGSRPDISLILKQCEIGILSSKSEGLPIALLEYAHTSLSVIATNVGDCKLIIDSKEKGELVKPKDVQALKRAILYALENDIYRASSASKLNRSVLKNFSKESVITQVVKVYTN